MVPDDGAHAAGSGAPRGEGAAEVAPECALARRRILAFLAGGQPRGEARALRTHLAGCLECDALYRAETTFVARMSREKRAARARRARGAATREPARAALAEREPGPRAVRAARAVAPAPAGLRGLVQRFCSARRGAARPRGLRLRAVLLPALALLVLGQSDRWRARPPLGFELSALSAGVAVGELELGPLAGARALEPGEIVSTGPEGRALVECAESRLVLGPGTRIALESSAARRFRLAEGALSARGPCDFVLHQGFVEVPAGAAADVSVEGSRARVRATAGEVAVSDARGRAALAAGAAAELGG